mmetsp:Transcript_24565/g.59127  ORF Transcript_24565/g.59127 Transcript_24565/m.59127 type:complete len:1153 (-) Transcript_24565:153-3611(-)|eukprot:CAMPEP_0114506074 /NCGR_PEP_ID=MMETSP0109-20121206/11217_1 /TAXON_ID=29199 /ORGANISM="Chlorarachnion reptans, Strain CCCM449" /LENGTH=1152 /DNA_ID=CAMNT_0001684605 /DNA_START=174 /DNA_END=3632 /DNA_ORIENTATION=-
MENLGTSNTEPNAGFKFEQEGGLQVTFKDQKEQLEITNAKIDVIVHGGQTEVRQRLTFFNPHERKLEGELLIPLPENATVCKFGKENPDTKEMLFATIVTKEKARVVFEAEVRERGKGAAIVEKVQGAGNLYKTRLYPLPPSSSVSIELWYFDTLNAKAVDKAAEMASKPKDAGLWFDLPDNLIGHIGHFLGPKDLGVLCCVNKRCERVIAPCLLRLPLYCAGQAKNLEVTVCARGGNKNSSVFPVMKENMLPLKRKDAETLSCTVSKPGRSQIAVAMPFLIGNREMVSVQALGKEEQEDVKGSDSAGAETYFSVLDRPLPAPKLVDGEEEKLNVANIGIIWDTSLSRNLDAKGELCLKTEMKVLESVMSNLLAESASAPKFSLYTFSTDLVKREEDLKDAKSVMSCVEKLKYKGGTHMEKLQLGAEHDFWIIFTDGISSIGPSSMPAIPSRPCYILSASATANRPYLKSVAIASGGVFFDLRNPRQVIEAPKQLGRPWYGFQGAEYDEGKIKCLHPNGAQPMASNERLALTGMLMPGVSEATITLNYGFSGATPSLSRKVRVVNAGEVGTLVPRCWAGDEVRALENGINSIAPEDKEARFVELGRKFALVTPGTSMLMLEELDQYLKHGVVPPKASSFYKDYQTRKTKEEADLNSQISLKLSSVKSMWSSRVSWWQKDFTAEHTGKIAAKKKKKSRAMPNRCMAAAPSALRMRASRMVANEFEEDDDSDEMDNVDCAMDEAEFGGDVEEKMAGDVEMKMEMKIGANNNKNTNNRQREAKGEISLAGVSKSAKDTNESVRKMRQEMGKGLEAALQVFDDERKKNAYAYGKTPSFYFDCASFLFEMAATAKDDAGKQQLQREALEVITSVLELGFEDPLLLRFVAYRLQIESEGQNLGKQGSMSEALSIVAKALFARVRKIRPEEPQSFRDYALALCADAERLAQIAKEPDQKDRLVACIEEALSNFARVVTGKWDGRFNEVEVTALMEMNAFIAKMSALKWVKSIRPNIFDLDQREDIKEKLPKELLKNLDCDLRVSLGWDADMTDVDLHVHEPSGEKAYYGNRSTRIGGQVSRDFTGGYGPEEYVIKVAMKGKYNIKAKYYASHREDFSGATTLLLRLTTDFGRAGLEKSKVVALRLTTNKEIVDVGTIAI